MEIFILIIISISILIYCIHIFYKRKNDIITYPSHIAFIMDGNGRWGKKHYNKREYGHIKGSYNIFDICNECFLNGSSYVTFYAFSEQNWKRPINEINVIFKTIYVTMTTIIKKRIMYKVLIQGRIDRLPVHLQNILQIIQKATKSYSKTVIICIDYSGRSEIAYACKKIIEQKLEPTVKNIADNLYIKDIPDPDLIIRTSGEHRISDFLLWQLYNSELYFCDVLWPDFTVSELRKAIINYNKRERRFGSISSTK